MASMERQIRIVLALDNKLAGDLAKASSGLKSFGSQLSSVGNQMTAALTLPIIAAGAAAIKMSMDFDKSLKNIQSISGQTNEQTKALGETFKKMSMDMSVTVDSAQNLADAFYDIQSSGFSGDDAMKVLQASTKAASAGLTTTKVAAQALTGVLNAYGASASEASHYSDVMFQTVNRGVVTFEQLSTALGSVTGVSAQLGVSFEEVGAAISTMTKQSISADTATTNLNAILTSLISPTDAMSKAFKDLGYESGSAMLSALGLGGTMQKLAEYSGGSAEKMQALFGNVRALRGALALTGKGAGMFADDLAAMQNSTGATQAAFQIQMQSFAAAFQHFQNVAGVALMEAGDIILPILANILNAVTGLLEWWIKLDDTTQSWILGLLAVVAAIGPILSIVGGLIGFFTSLATIIPIITGGLAAFGAGVVALLTPLGLFVAVFALIIAAILGNWFGLRDAIVGSVGAIVNALSVVGDAFKGVGSMVMQGWGNIGQHLAETISQLVVIAMAATGKFFEVFFGIGQNIINGIIKGIAVNIVKFIDMVEKMANDASNAVRNAFGIHSPSKVFEGIGKNIVAGLHKGVEGMGGIGVKVSQSGSVSRQPTLSYGGVGASGGSSGGAGHVFNNTFVLPEGTTRQQAREFLKIVGEQAERRGAKKTK